MDALSRVYEGLAPEGILLDLMPFEPWVPVETADGARLANLDCREFARGARAAQAELLSCGLFRLEEERFFDVLEHFENGPRLLEVVSTWGRTRVPKKLVSAVERAEPPFRVRERVVLRRLRALRQPRFA